MSTKTRRDKRQAHAEAPVETDWLWACPSGTSLSEIANTLGFTNEPQSELSARLWGDQFRFRDDIYLALFSEAPFSKRDPRVGWDALDEHLQDACRNGRLIVIRDLPSDGTVPHAMQMLIHIVGFRRVERGFHSFESRPGARFAMVIDGWTRPTIRVHSRQAEVYVVRPLPGKPLVSS